VTTGKRGHERDASSPDPKLTRPSGTGTVWTAKPVRAVPFVQSMAEETRAAMEEAGNLRLRLADEAQRAKGIKSRAAAAETDLELTRNQYYAL